MKRIHTKRIFLTATASSLALCAISDAHADVAPGEQVLGEIVVTARRHSESLQNVPVSVQVVTGDTIQKLSIVHAEEIAKLAPGLTITPPLTGGINQAIILRGVRWSPGSGTAAIPVYLNEGNFGPITGLESLFDVGQVEVLRGPQGTTRGAASISGAITVTTRRPDLDTMGGYVQGLFGEGGHENVQGAVGVPVIPGKLAIRLAGTIENVEANRVSSLNNSDDPAIRLRKGRVSLRFRPVDSLTIDTMYQASTNNGGFYAQVVGNGSPGNPAAGIPAGYNGPPIVLKDYHAVQDQKSWSFAREQDLTLNVGWHVLGQHVSYNYAHQNVRDTAAVALDPGNSLPKFEPFQLLSLPTTMDMHEFRLSSIRGKHLLDYDIGWYHRANESPVTVDQAAHLPGAFGFVPGVITQPLTRYTLPVHVDIPTNVFEDSFFGNLQLHLPSDIELSAGLRRMRGKSPSASTTTLGGAFVAAFHNPFPLPCGVLSPILVGSPVLPGYCDVAVPPSTSTNFNNNSFKTTVWNTSLSKKFTENVLVYVTVGTSFRPGLRDTEGGLPMSLTFTNPEKATSYEAGVKATNWGGKLRVNADIYQIDYQGQLTTFQGIPFYDTTTQSVSATTLSFFQNIDAKVRGFEAEIDVRPIDYLTLSANLSYSDIKTTQGGFVPCNDPTRPVTPTNPINFCPAEKGQNVNPSAPFQASLFAAYERPITNELDGYLRSNLNIQGHSPNFGISLQPTSSYTIMDLYAGVSSPHTGLEVGLYAKNLFNTKKELTRLQLQSPYATFGQSGYVQVTSTLPREAGVQVRWSFGSH